MRTYEVTVRRTYETVLEVEAESIADAIDMAQNDEECLSDLNIAESEQFDCRSESYKAKWIRGVK